MHSITRTRLPLDPAGSAGPQADYIWRIILMFGAIPAALAYYWRMKIPETARYTIMQGIRQLKTWVKFYMLKSIPKRQRCRSWLKNRPIHLSSSLGNSLAVMAFTYLEPLLHGFSRTLPSIVRTFFQKDVLIAIEWIPKARTMNAIHVVYMISKAQFLIAPCMHRNLPGKAEVNLPWYICISWEGRSHSRKTRVSGMLPKAQIQARLMLATRQVLVRKSHSLCLDASTFWECTSLSSCRNPKGKSLEELSGENCDDDVEPADTRSQATSKDNVEPTDPMAAPNSVCDQI
ncbi:hypothetical protein F0562_000485 [Nyssa sinensis]|uniref:Uncharacterized protein n=1 Tax=Nyssa sinensis TaxID=561372 RepID=A0A5J5C5C5_9ASTE|nr:hypothetical protein F0562_000485 [Nyssa sinensis]